MLSLLTLLLATTPITRQGSTCPLGYYRQAGHCIPTTRTYHSIPQSGSSCPLGTYRTASYCSWTTR
jgi:hypothetical protein